jgi:hypothetical protein
MIEPLSNTVSWERTIHSSSEEFFVIDNFLRPEHFRMFKNSVESFEQPWSFIPSVSSKSDYETTGLKNAYGFTFVYALDDHYLHETMAATPYVGAFNEQVKKYFKMPSNTQIHRSNVFMTTYRGDQVLSFTPHVDTVIPHYTCIYHFHNTDAPTIFYNETHEGIEPYEGEVTIKEKVDSVENRLIMFKGNTLHSGCVATNVPNRIVLNTNFVFVDDVDNLNS